MPLCVCLYVFAYLAARVCALRNENENQAKAQKPRHQSK